MIYENKQSPLKGFAGLLVVFVLLLLSLASCADSQDDTLPTAPNSGGTVELILKLSVSQGTDATPSESGLFPVTRAVDDTDTPPYSQVKNVWVLQFDGQGDDAVLTGVPVYIADYDTKSEVDRVCTLPTGTAQTVWFLANTFDDALVWDADLTLGQLKMRSIQIATEADLHRRGDATATPGAGYPDDYDYYLIMNGTYKGSISATTNLECMLYRNAVRFDFRLKNATTGGDVVIIDSVKVRGIMRRQFLYNSYELPAVFPTAGQEAVWDGKAVTYDKGIPDGDYTHFRFYLPANKRGVNPAIANKWEKNRFAPAGATSVRVYGHYAEEGNVVSVVYTFYPGADQTTDFNLLPDHSYTCNVEITGVGDPALDSRVQVMDIRDFAAPGEERGNCYMLNPNPAGMRQFRIPVDRINLFWGGQGYENVPANTIGSSDNWTAEALWSDFTPQDSNPGGTDYFKFVKGTGTGTESNKDGYFTVEVGPKTTGNVLVAVKKNGTILWSWHLWITDYDPYQGVLSGVYYAEAVPGGLYLRSKQATTDGSGKYFGHMDRWLGANKSTGFPLYYQYGRKDPFRLDNGTTLNAAHTVLESIVTRAESTYKPTQPAYLSIATLPIYNSAGGGYDWLSPDVSNRDNVYVWRDMTQNASEGKTGKSLFDPCPPGWRVPRTVNDVNWTWDTLNDKNGNDIIEGNPEGLSWNMIFPYGQLAYPGSNTSRYGCEAMGAWVQLFGGNVYPGVTINWKTGWNSARDRTYLGNNTIADYGWEFRPGNSRAALLAVLPVRDHY